MVLIERLVRGILPFAAAGLDTPQPLFCMGGYGVFCACLSGASQAGKRVPFLYMGGYGVFSECSLCVCNCTSFPISVL